MCYFIKVAHSRDSHVLQYSNDPHQQQREEEEEEQSRAQRQAASLMMSEYNQAREMSLMVSALTRVVSGEAASSENMTSAPAAATTQLPIKRERENETAVPEEVLRYYRGFAQQWWTGSRQIGEASTSSIPRGELLLPLASFFSSLFF